MVVGDRNAQEVPTLEFEEWIRWKPVIYEKHLLNHRRASETPGLQLKGWTDRVRGIRQPLGVAKQIGLAAITRPLHAVDDGPDGVESSPLLEGVCQNLSRLARRLNLRRSVRRVLPCAANGDLHLEGRPVQGLAGPARLHGPDRVDTKVRAQGQLFSRSSHTTQKTRTGADESLEPPELVLASALFISV